MNLKIVYNDGGRAAAGFKGTAGDCVCRALSIASGRPYAEVYSVLADKNAESGRRRGKRSAREGINTKAAWFKQLMVNWGFSWTPTMGIGTGCRVHLRGEELPAGRLVANISHHLVAVIDGVMHDTHDPSRGGTRCVYGYWKLEH